MSKRKPDRKGRREIRRTPPEVKTQLEAVAQMRDFATRRLGSRQRQLPQLRGPRTALMCVLERSVGRRP